MTLLRSERLSLIPFSLAEADALFRIRGDTEAMEFWDWPADATREDSQAIARTMLDEIAAGTACVWTMRRADDGVFVGVVDLSEIAHEEADLGFMVLRAYWGRGFAYEAASTIVEEAWKRGFARLRARTHVDNMRSRKLLERLGFVAAAEREVEVRPGVVKTCAFFTLERPAQGSSSLSQ